MERKVASDYPQELLDLFHEYQHGDIDRRTFLDRAVKFAVGGLTVAAIFESLTPNYAWAQQVPADDKRIKVGYEVVQSPAGNGSIKGYLARPAKGKKLPVVLVIHENRDSTLHRRRSASSRGSQFHRLRARRIDFSGRLSRQRRERCCRFSPGGWKEDDGRFRRGGEVAQSPFRFQGETGRGGILFRRRHGESTGPAAGPDLNAGVVFYGRQAA